MTRDELYKLLLSQEEIVAKCHDLFPENAGIYILLMDEEIVYIGRSINIVARVGAHIRNDLQFNKYTIVPMSYADSCKWEEIYINAYRPKYNSSKMMIPFNERENN